MDQIRTLTDMWDSHNNCLTLWEEPEKKMFWNIFVSLELKRFTLHCLWLCFSVFCWTLLYYFALRRIAPLWFWCQYRSEHSRDHQSVALENCSLLFYIFVCIEEIVPGWLILGGTIVWLMCKNNALLLGRQENEKFRWNNLRHSCRRSSILHPPPWASQVPNIRRKKHIVFIFFQ